MKVVFLVWIGLPVDFFRHFCCMMYHLATKHSKRLKGWLTAIYQQQTSGIKSRLQL